MEQTIKNAEERMEKSLLTLEEEFSMIRAGRANPKLLSKISVDYYGAPTPLQQVANVSVPEARVIMIQPWDKSLIKPDIITSCHVQSRISCSTHALILLMNNLYP